MQISLVSPAQVAGIWPRVQEFIQASIKAGTEDFFGEWDVKKSCIGGQWGLWIVDDAGAIRAAIVTRFDDYPKCRVCLILFCGGERAREWIAPAQIAIEAHARQYGCKYVEAWGRNGWLRLCGGKEVTRVMRKELT